MTQPLALRLAYALDAEVYDQRSRKFDPTAAPQAATELRRLNSECVALAEAACRLARVNESQRAVMRQVLTTLQNALDFTHLPEHHMERRYINDAITALREALGEQT